MTEVEKLFEEFKGRLVEVECKCDNEKRAKCVMYPEYCDGTRKEIIDLVQLIDEGLNNKLLADKDTRIEELEKEISNLLSCKSCPENKGGLLCQKEYEDKCLSQKIQYIKELKEENAELKTQAKKIILKLYNVGRDVLMCRADEAAYDNLSTVINDRSIEQFLQENNNEQSRT